MKFQKRIRINITKKLAGLVLMLGMLFNLSFANIVIWPTTLQMNPKDKAITLWVENQGATTQVYQARIFDWSLKGGDDSLNPQSNLMISPPMIKVAPGEKQMFRIVSRTPVSSGVMKSFRVVLDEIPQKALAGILKKDAGSSQGIQFQFRYSIPVFVYGDGMSNEDRRVYTSSEKIKHLTWKVATENGKSYLNITNNSPYYMHVSNVSFDVDGKSKGVSGYLLPKSTRKIELDSYPAGSSIYGEIDGAKRIKF